ncbi:hypothetical protein ACQCSX_16330 [Pseudarthrobacter sp. P1]|uniref:hypothetical protein n=1 Tax=Pseudarthrobacter sp. P1 TaxID=3418418 RepID=UPI003CE7F916
MLDADADGDGGSAPGPDAGPGATASGYAWHAPTAWVVAAVLAVVGAVLVFAPRIFTGSLAPGAVHNNGASMSLQPWPSVAAAAGPSFLLVGLGLAAVGLFLRAAARSRGSTPAPPATAFTNADGGNFGSTEIHPR